MGDELGDPHPELTKVWVLGPAPRLPVPRTAQPPKIDGQVSDACWKSATQTGPFIWTFEWGGGSYFYPMGYVSPKAGCNAWVCWDNEYLYVAFRFEEPLMKYIRTSYAHVWWNDDGFVRLSPNYGISAQGQFPSYYSIAVGATNAVQDWGFVDPATAKEKGEGWSANGLQSAVTLAADHWIVEMAIPFAALDFPAPKAGDVWGADFGRMRWTPFDAAAKGVKDAGYVEISSWAGFGDTPLVCDLQLGEILFTDQPISVKPRAFMLSFLGRRPSQAGRPSRGRGSSGTQSGERRPHRAGRSRAW